MAGEEEGFLERVCALPEPDDYFQGVDWEGLCLPRNILAFCRQEESKDGGDWGGISANTGRYDQHSRFVLLVALEGAGRVGVEREVWQFEGGDGILMFPHQVHYYMELAERFCWLFITFDLESDERAVLDPLRDAPRRLTVEARRRLLQFMEVYRSAASGGSAESALQASVGLGNLLGDFRAGERLEAVGPGGGTVARVREFVFSHLASDLSVEAIAKEMGCSGSYLRERFREDAGVSLGHFVRLVRLAQATHLLRRSGKGVREIAEDCGFGSFTTFSRAFSRVYGMSPSEYRKTAKRSERVTPKQGRNRGDALFSGNGGWPCPSEFGIDHP